MSKPYRTLFSPDLGGILTCNTTENGNPVATLVTPQSVTDVQEDQEGGQTTIEISGSTSALAVQSPSGVIARVQPHGLVAINDVAGANMVALADDMKMACNSFNIDGEKFDTKLQRSPSRTVPAVPGLRPMTP